MGENIAQVCPFKKRVVLVLMLDYICGLQGLIVCLLVQPCFLLGVVQILSSGLAIGVQVGSLTNPDHSISSPLAHSCKVHIGSVESGAVIPNSCYPD
jgi:hypothetical protein